MEARYVRLAPMTTARPISVEALRTLARAGASDTLLGQAVRELLDASPSDTDEPAGAASDKSSPAGKPLPPSATSAGPRSSDSATSITLTTSVRPPSSAAAALPPTASPLETTATKKPTEPPPASAGGKSTPAIIGFRDKHGKRSSVSVAAKKWAGLLELQPDEKKLMALAREIAIKAPDDGNRSEWVYEALKAKLSE